ncbi:probable inactive receptor kinase At1g48480 [Henckelia pumila]|uniref:probable inactive receptor kinase At1g48480 n=1 Tax=Henckelia pumila TaxID=405737 RepID=UPI003C6E95F5
MVSHHFYFLLLFLSTLSDLTLSDLENDRTALLRLRAAIRGRTLLWNRTDATPCSWEGVTCDNTTNRVIGLRLPGDGLVGQLPTNTVGNLSELRALSLRRNALSGPLPSDLALCTHLIDLHLQGNNFSGEIPSSFFTLTNLVRVNLARNNFSGDFSSGFNELTSLRTLYLENNQFTGSLPDLSGLNNLRQFNVSFNRLTGSIPMRLHGFSAQSFIGTSLCGGVLVSCSNAKDGSNLSGGAIAGISVGSVVGLLSILMILFILRRKYRTGDILSPAERSPMPPSPVKPTEHESWDRKPVILPEENIMESNNIFSSQYTSDQRLKMAIKNGGSDGLVFIGDDVNTFTLQDLLKSSAEVLGKGRVGSTYKAYLENGAQVIVKRLRNVVVSEKEFRSKIEDVGSLIHENLLPLRGYFYGREEKLLVYEPMPNGSLFALLHVGNKKQPLSWEIRSRIALGAARAIEYLHSNGPGTTHGNIKSSNIFLTNYYYARVSEQGLTQVVSPSSNMDGYRAPEVTDSRRTLQPADVYSFGVILLELLTSKSPDDALTEEGIILPSWVRSVVQEKWTIEVFDPELLEYENLQEQMVQLLHLAISCTSQSPERRPVMAEITRRIGEICGSRD